MPELLIFFSLSLPSLGTPEYPSNSSNSGLPAQALGMPGVCRKGNFLPVVKIPIFLRGAKWKVGFLESNCEKEGVEFSPYSLKAFSASSQISPSM